MPAADPAQQEGAWDRVSGVECVECPTCAFTFGADHETVMHGYVVGYSCPNCAEVELRRSLHAAEEALRGLGWDVGQAVPCWCADGTLGQRWFGDSETGSPSDLDFENPDDHADVCKAARAYFAAVQPGGDTDGGEA